MQLAKMRPGERKKVDFNVKGQPIGVNASPFANYYGTIVRDPMNAPPQVGDFAEIPQDNKLKMWDLVLEKFALGLSDEEEEEQREKKIKEKKTLVMRSLNKKYRNYRARIKRYYYDTEDCDTERLKDKNRPPDMEKDDWQWLVKHFGSEKFQAKSKRNISSRAYQDAGHTTGTQNFAQVAHEMYKKDKVMPDLLKFYEVVHTRKDKTPVTKVAQETLSKVQGLLAKRDAGEISLTNEENYAEVRPTEKSGRDRGKGVSPSITALYSSFGDAEKL